MLKYIFLVIFTTLLIRYNLNSRDSKIDSLIQVIDTVTSLESKSYKYADLGQKYWFTNPDSAIYWCKKGEKLSQEIGYQDGLAQAWSVMGVAYDIKGYDSLSLHYHFKALDIFRQLDDSLRIANSLVYISNAYKVGSDFMKSLDFLYEALEIYKKKNDPVYLGATYNNLGNLYSLFYNFPKALEYHFKALEIKEQLTDTNQLAASYSNISSIYYRMDDLKQAIKYMQKGIQLRKKTNMDIKLAYNYVNLASLYDDNKEYDSAYHYFDLALDIFEEKNIIRGIATVYNFLGSHYLSLKEYKKAKEYSLLSLEKYKESNFGESGASLLLNLSEIFHKEKNINDAFKFANESLEHATKTNQKNNQMRAYQQLSRLYENTGNLALALKYYQNYSLLKDSIFTDNMAQEVNAMKLQRERLEKDRLTKDIELQNAQIQVAENQLKIGKIIIITIAIGLIVFVLAFVLIYRERKKTQLINVQLSEKNIRIQEQQIDIEKRAEEAELLNKKLIELGKYKENLTNMIVHDLKNPLNAIINSDITVDPANKIEGIRNYSRQMLNLVLNILDVQKFEETKIKLEIIQVNAFKLVKRSIENVIFLALKKNIEIVNHANRNLLFVCDEELIDRVITNLLLNAIKYSEYNSKIDVFVDYDAAKSKAIVSVQDYGKGIPKGNQSKIFKKFTQLDKTSSGKVKSTGLGLTFCKLAVESSGDKIWVDSSEGNGAKFLFTLDALEEEVENKIDNIEFLTNDNLNKFNENEIKLLDPILQDIESCRMYEISKLKKITKNLINSENEKISLWANELIKSAQNFNQKRYEEILRISQK